MGLKRTTLIIKDSGLWRPSDEKVNGMLSSVEFNESNGKLGVVGWWCVCF